MHVTVKVNMCAAGFICVRKLQMDQSNILSLCGDMHVLL